MPEYPVILLRGFDPVGGADRDPFTGYNDGTAYTGAVYQSRDFEGFVINFYKDASRSYRDTINVFRFHPPLPLPHPELGFGLADSCFSKADPEKYQAWQQLGQSDPAQAARSLWVFNYYAASQGNVFKRRGFRTVPYFARELQRFIEQVLKLTKGGKVNIIAHSMGGVILRHLVQRRYKDKADAQRRINRIVTLGSPLTGISYMEGGVVEALRSLLGLGDQSELDAMDPSEILKPALKLGELGGDSDFLPSADTDIQPANHYGLINAALWDGKKKISSDEKEALARRIDLDFDPRRWLCVVGTDPESYSAALGRLGSALRGHGGRTDGLVAQDNAWLEGSPRSYLHKPHGGPDGLQTSRESYEVATRFFFGTHDISVRLKAGGVIANFDRNSQYYLGASIKVRGVDFFLHQMDRESKNCIVLFEPGRESDWLGLEAGQRARLKQEILLWEGSLDMTRALSSGQMVFRFDFNLYGEDKPSLLNPLRLLSLKHSDQIVAQEQFVAIFTPSPDRLYWFRNSKEIVGMAAQMLKSPMSVGIKSAAVKASGDVAQQNVNSFLAQLAASEKQGIKTLSAGPDGAPAGTQYVYDCTVKGDTYTIDGLPVDTLSFHGELLVQISKRKD
ncbi:alpha/beta hydrolase [bacterium]|nr:alpha/beta hydrolase [bacterium]